MHKLSLWLIIIKPMVLQTSGIGQSYWLLVIIIGIENSRDREKEREEYGEIEALLTLQMDRQCADLSDQKEEDRISINSAASHNWFMFMCT